MLGDTQWCSPCCCCKQLPEDGYFTPGDFSDKCWNVFGAAGINRLRFESTLPGWFPVKLPFNQGDVYPPFPAGVGQAFHCLLWPPANNIKDAEIRIRATTKIGFKWPPGFQKEVPSFDDRIVHLTPWPANECHVSLFMTSDPQRVGWSMLGGNVIRSYWEYTDTKNPIDWRENVDGWSPINYESHKLFQANSNKPTQYIYYPYTVGGGGPGQWPTPINPTWLPSGPIQVIDETFYLEDGWWYALPKRQIVRDSQLLLHSPGGFLFGIGVANVYGIVEVEVLDFFVEWKYS